MENFSFDSHTIYVTIEYVLTSIKNAEGNEINVTNDIFESILNELCRGFGELPFECSSNEQNPFNGDISSNGNKYIYYNGILKDPLHMIIIENNINYKE